MRYPSDIVFNPVTCDDFDELYIIFDGQFGKLYFSRYAINSIQSKEFKEKSTEKNAKWR